MELESRVAVPMILMLKLLCFGERTGITYVDSTCVPVYHNKRIKRNNISKIMPKWAKVQWASSMDLSCILYVMIRENY